MKLRTFISTFLLLLTTILTTFSVFFIAPQKVHAIPVVEIGPNLWESTLSAVSNGLTAIATPITAVSTFASKINEYILQPYAFIKSGALLKVLTASVIKFVTGTANGTGVPQFVANTQKSLQQLSDMKARAYLSQMNLTGSPFASSIAAALGVNYMQGSSLGGFWAANMNTLRAGAAGIPMSANIPAYLAGNWSQGGVAAWFALTTQVQNNPYTFYQNTQAQLANVIGPGVGGATGARLAELSWGKGMLSWCGASDSNGNALPSTPNPNAGADGTVCDYASAGEADGTWQGGHCVSNGTHNSAAINPGDPCTQSNGTAGTIKTPGSVISDSLTKVLGVGPDKLVQMGNIGTQLSGILGNIANIMGTINLAKDVLSGPSNGGLLGSSNSPAFNDTAATASALGVIDKAAANMASGSGMSERLSLYKTAWDTISTTANTASTNVNVLISTCTSNSTNAATQITALQGSSDITAQDQINQLQAFIAVAGAQIIAAQAVLTQQIAPVLTQVINATATTTAATAMLQKANPSAADLQTLSSMSPTGTEVATAQKNATVSGMATAIPEGSLTVSGGTLVDQMTLFSTNAIALKTSVCTFSPASGNVGGGM